MKTQHLNCNLIELKLAPPDAGIMEFSGYGAVFGNVDAYGDVIEPGAFSKFLADVKSGAQLPPAMLLQHGGWQVTADDMMPLGIWTELSEDGTGLKVTGRLADTQRGIETYKLMKMEPRPAITGLSIGYIAKESEPRSKPEDPRRRLKRIDLVEISPVTFPANGLARVSAVKSAYDLSEREFEQFLRDSAGLSRKDAQTVISRGFRAIIAERDSGSEELKQIASLIERTVTIFSNP